MKREKEQKVFDYTVEVKDGVQLLYYKGQPLPHQLTGTVSQEPAMVVGDTRCIFTLKVYAKLKDTK